MPLHMKTFAEGRACGSFFQKALLLPLRCLGQGDVSSVMHIFPTISFTLLPNSKLQSSSKSFTNTTTVQPHDQKTDKIHTPRVPYHGSQPYAFFTNDFKRAWPYDNHITRSLTVIACLSMLTCALGIAALLLVSENVRSKYLLPHKLVAMAVSRTTEYWSCLGSTNVNLRPLPSPSTSL